MRIAVAFLAVICLLVGGISEAAVRAGVEVSARYSWIGPTETGYVFGIPVDLDPSPVWAPAIGLEVDVPLSPTWHFEPHLRYVENGQEATASTSFSTSKQTIREQQLALLALFRYHARPWGSLSIGPEVAYLLSGTVSGTYQTGSQAPVDYDADYTHETQRWDLLMVGGAGTRYPVGRHAITLEFRATHGIVLKERPGVYIDMLGRAVPWQYPPLPRFTTVLSWTRALEVVVGYLW